MSAAIHLLDMTRPLHTWTPQDLAKIPAQRGENLVKSHLHQLMAAGEDFSRDIVTERPAPVGGPIHEVAWEREGALQVYSVWCEKTSLCLFPSLQKKFSFIQFLGRSHCIKLTMKLVLSWFINLTLFFLIFLAFFWQGSLYVHIIFLILFLLCLCVGMGTWALLPAEARGVWAPCNLSYGQYGAGPDLSLRQPVCTAKPSYIILDRCDIMLLSEYRPNHTM